nr:crossover junction endodeoxyribonuclease RuvC [Oceanococcus sp. HetDA_MAG_MS8]
MPMRILGIDPGSVYTGYAVLAIEGNKLLPLANGRWHLRGSSIGQRLLQLQENLQDLIEVQRPSVAAVETVFVQKNPNTAIKLGQARGVILCTLARYALDTHEYTPATIKQTLCGNGRADKEQIGWMVGRLLGMRPAPEADAADAAAVAICHHHHAPLRRLKAAQQ